MHKPDEIASKLMGVPYEKLDERAKNVARHVAGRKHIARDVTKSFIDAKAKTRPAAREAVGRIAAPAERTAHAAGGAARKTTAGGPWAGGGCLKRHAALQFLPNLAFAAVTHDALASPAIASHFSVATP
jgi:hypothetical protein